MYKGYIYIIKNKLNKNKVYIGQTRASIEQRWRQHRSGAKHRKNNNSVLYNAMNKYGEENFSIEIIKTIECDTKDELIDLLNELEIYYISKYNSVTPNGYNLTIGGNNTSVRYSKPVTSYFYNGEMDKTFDSMNEAARFYHVDPSHIARCCNGLSQLCGKKIWRYRDDSFEKFPILITKEQLENNFFRPVDKYTKDGIFLKSYNTIAEAITDDEQVNSSTPISYCCDGKYNQAFGYVWRNHGVPFNAYDWKVNQKFTQVDSYDLDGNFLKSFQSIADAQRYYDIENNAHIIQCCNGERKTCNNMVWRYKKEPFEKYATERKKKIGKAINHYDLNNLFIETITGVKNIPNYSKGIYECCNGLRTHVNDSKWFYADDINNPDKSRIIGKPKDYGTSNNVPVIFNKFIEPICVYDRYGNFIKEYPDARTLSKEEKIFTQTIYDVCDGIFAYNKGFVYRYKKDNFDLYYDFSYRKKHINIYDKSDNFIMECYDIQECIRQLNLDTKKGSSIQKCLIHDRKYAYGYQFFRVDDSTQPDKSKIISAKEVKSA